MLNAKKKTTTVVVAILLLVLLTVGGVIAYMVATSSLTNNFTVGSFETPVPGDDPTPGGNDPIQEGDSNWNGHLYEPSWVNNSKIMPGTSVAKDPYVGIGAGSEDAYVYVYVKNNFKNTGNTIGFNINNGWVAVDATPVTDTDGETEAFYTGGLFKYTGGLTDALNANATVWTSTPLFSTVQAKDEATVTDLSAKDGADQANIVVYAYIHQMKDNGNNITESDVDDAAKAYVAKLNNNTAGE